MAIDPSLISTARVDQLPAAPITPTSILPHGVGTELKQGTVQEILDLVSALVATYKPYEVKLLAVTDLYVDTNFDMADGPTKGLGKSGGLWSGWAVMNGNNGTVNMDDSIPLGFGATRNSMLAQVGENTKALTKNNIPPLDSNLEGSNDDNSQPGRYVCTSDEQPNGVRVRPNSVNAASTQTPVNIMQKSVVLLYIMKLP